MSDEKKSGESVTFKCNETVLVIGTGGTERLGEIYAIWPSTAQPYAVAFNDDYTAQRCAAAQLRKVTIQ